MNTAVKHNSNPKNKKHISKRKKKDYFWAYVMLAPTMIGLLVLNIFPIIQTILLSFQKTGDFGNNTWIGFDNYKKLFSDPVIIQATVNTFKYAIIVVPVTVILALIIAVLLNQKIKGKTIYRTIYFLPMVAAPAAIAMVWKWLYNADFGLLNYILSALGMDSVNWITDPNIALYSVALVGIWSGVGYSMIILLAGLQEIPNDFYEAADVDGAGPVTKFFKITVPLVSPTLFFVVVTSIISALQVFDSIFMMISKTNPAIDTTQSLIYLYYQQSFVINNKGYGSTIAMFLLAIILIITLIQLKLQKKWVHYQ